MRETDRETDREKNRQRERQTKRERMREGGRSKGGQRESRTETKRKEMFYGVGHVVKDHSDSERGNPLLPLHGLLFSISSKECIICPFPQTGQHIP